MALLKSIQMEIDAVALAFCQKLVALHNLQEEELMSLWHETCGKKVPATLRRKASTVSHGHRKETSYNVFSRAMRPVICEEHPDWKFGKISSEIGARWRKLSVEEKSTYVPVAKMSTPAQAVLEEESMDLMATETETTTVIAPLSVVEPKTKTTTIASKKRGGSTKKKEKEEEKPENALESMKRPQLLQECKTRGIRLRGRMKNEDIVRLIRLHEESEATESEREEEEDTKPKKTSGKSKSSSSSLSFDVTQKDESSSETEESENDGSSEDESSCAETEESDEEDDLVEEDDEF